VTDRATHRARLAAQLLTGRPARMPEHVVERLLAVQAQDGRGFRLALRARTTGLLASDVDAALTERRTLVVSWLQRGTLHLVAAHDHAWLHALTTPQLLPGVERRLGQLGVSAAQADRGVGTVAAEVADGPRTRAELRAALDAAGVPTAGQALVHLLFLASLRSDLVRGPLRGKEHCFVSASAWLGPQEEVDHDEALVRLARRYLAGHGPADDRDLARWAGIPLRDARAGLAALGDEVVRRPDGRLQLEGTPPPGASHPPLLLGPFDPLLLGWTSRDDVVGPHVGIVTTNGLFRACALVRGRAVATWGLDDGRVTLRPLERISSKDLAALERDAADVLRFLGLPPRSWRVARAG
jgi:hypothetical protein